jgi:hypothetical protein
MGDGRHIAISLSVCPQAMLIVTRNKILMEDLSCCKIFSTVAKFGRWQWSSFSDPVYAVVKLMVINRSENQQNRAVRPNYFIIYRVRTVLSPGLKYSPSDPLF